MEKTKLSQLFVFISFLSFVTLFVMVVQQSYNNLINPSKQIVPEALLRPISSSLDISVVKGLESLIEYPTDVLDTSSTISIATSSASSSAILNPTP